MTNEFDIAILCTTINLTSRENKNFKLHKTNIKQYFKLNIVQFSACLD